MTQLIWSKKRQNSAAKKSSKRRTQVIAQKIACIVINVTNLSHALPLSHAAEITLATLDINTTWCGVVKESKSGWRTHQQVKMCLCVRLRNAALMQTAILRAVIAGEF